MGMVASMHKLTAGSGYDYLTRRVAARDTTGELSTNLASYHSEKGELVGTWWGSGLYGLADVHQPSWRSTCHKRFQLVVGLVCETSGHEDRRLTQLFLPSVGLVRDRVQLRDRWPVQLLNEFSDHLARLKDR